MSGEAPFGWRGELERERRQKDEYLGTHPQSPLPAPARHDFDELEYFEPDPSLRFEVPLEERTESETITVETTTGGERRYEHVGEFRVEIDGETIALQAYRSTDIEDRLWVPFRDATNGAETYGGGRYLDLDDPGDRANDDGDWVLDFNRAYNPFCAYSDAYECALVPPENWLDVPIWAGEKAFDGDAGSAVDT